ncbi:MAG: sle [Subtercola sp.]|nr:sle [Subtercola sp.]
MRAGARQACTDDQCLDANSSPKRGGFGGSGGDRDQVGGLLIYYMLDPLDVRNAVTDINSEPYVLFERRGKVALLTLNRPEIRNVVFAEMSTALAEAIDLFEADGDLRVAVLTGAGSAFCAGMDLKAFSASVDKAIPTAAGHPEWGFAGITRRLITKPVIAAVNGGAFGGGAEVALACDLIVADENALFALPEASFGIFPAEGGVVRLGQLIPQKIALELLLTGRRFTASEALSWGLVNRVASSGKSLEGALALAELIAANAPLSTQAIKRVVYRAEETSHLDGAAWQINDSQVAAVFSSADAIEGPLAFIEKRVAQWTGK